MLTDSPPRKANRAWFLERPATAACGGNQSPGASHPDFSGDQLRCLFLRRCFRIEPLETKKRPRLLGAVLVSGSSNDARSCRLWHGSSQAGLRLTHDLLIVIGNDPLHIDACAFDPRFVRQSLELKLNFFSLLGRQEGDGKSGGFACGGLNFHRVWV